VKKGRARSERIIKEGGRGCPKGKTLENVALTSRLGRWDQDRNGAEVDFFKKGGMQRRGRWKGSSLGPERSSKSSGPAKIGGSKRPAPYEDVTGPRRSEGGERRSEGLYL